MPLRAVVFDLFDTLVDISMDRLPRVEIGGRRIPSTADALYAQLDPERAPPREHFLATLREVDQALRAPRAEQGRELPTLERFEAVVERLGLRDGDLPRRLTECHMALLRQQVTCLAHHVEVVRRLRERFRVAVCSNFSHSETALRVLEEAGLRWHLDAIIVSDAVGYRKPRAEIFEATLGALRVAPGEALHVGDSLPADVAGAAGVGLRTAWLTRRVSDPARALAEHAGPAPDLVVADLAELPDLLASDAD